MSLLFKLFGAIGLILITYGVWLKNEQKQDYFFIFGSLGLLSYSLYINNPIFIILQTVFIISTAYELYKLKS